MRNLLCLLTFLVMSYWIPSGRAEEPQSDATEAVLAAAEASTQFTFDLYRQLAVENDNNLFLSGYSVTSAFMMLAEGAVGPAADEIGNTFHLPRTMWSGDAQHPWRFDTFGTGCAALEEAMIPGDAAAMAESQRELQEFEARWERLQTEIENARGNDQFRLMRQERVLIQQINSLRQQINPYQLRFANAIWCDTGFPLRDDYLTAINRSWGALAFGCDFRGQPEQERLNINSWVNDRTNGLIPDLLPRGSVSEITRVILTNAVYFKGNWEVPFREAATDEQPFFLASGEEAAAMMMKDLYRDSHYVELTPRGEVNDYVQVEAPADSRYDFVWELPENPDGFKLLELPYRGDAMSMILILPNRPNGLDELEAALTYETFAEWKNTMASREVDVYLPRFTMRNTLELQQTLQTLGLEGIFREGGLTGLSDHPDAEQLVVNRVIQQAFVAVNEEGTEAAAATAILTEGAAEPVIDRKPTPEFRADHPFLYFIQHRETGAIVFMGRMMNPAGT